MRTVIFAKKQHIDWLNRYRMFFDPFMTSEMCFCEWKMKGETVSEIIPDVYRCIGGEREWNAVLLYDEPSARGRLNPFDTAKEEPFVYEEVDTQDMKDTIVRFEEKLQKKAELRKAAYDQAVTQPLTRLGSFLCAMPLDTSSEEIVAEPDPEADNNDPDTLIEVLTERKHAAEFNYYKQIASHRKQLREQLMEKGVLDANLPVNVYCISLRTVASLQESAEQAMSIAWKSPSDLRYTDFCDRNLYYDRMRFFVYDILPEQHINYKFSYLEFIYTLLVFAGNTVPQDAAGPGQLYRLYSNCNEEKLKALVGKYDRKLENTVGILKRRQDEILSEMPGPISDVQAEKTFQSKCVIPVELNPNVDLDGYYGERNEFGLYVDTPTEESYVWGSMEKRSGKAMHTLMKQPRRSLEKSVETLRGNSRSDSVSVLALNHFQIDDIREYTESEEDAMVCVPTKDFYDLSRYEKNRLARSKDIKELIAARMTKKAATRLMLAALLLFLIGLLPIIIFNMDSMAGSPAALILPAAGLALLAVVGFIALSVYRSELRGRIDDYNNVMRGIRGDVDSSMVLFSRYLSHVCHVMRGYSALEETIRKDNVFKQRIRVIRAHIEQIRDLQSELRDLFGEYLGEHSPENGGDAYRYNFEIPTEYEYPIPFKEEGNRPIPFIEDGNLVEIPYSVVEKVMIRMEELYE